MNQSLYPVNDVENHESSVNIPCYNILVVKLFLVQLNVDPSHNAMSFSNVELPLDPTSVREMGTEIPLRSSLTQDNMSCYPRKL